MLGWHISVYRQADNKRLAVWQANWQGLHWLTGLVESGHVEDLGGDGYPNRYTAAAAIILPCIVNGPPHANEHWHHDPGDILTEKWEGKTVRDHDAIASCAPGEELLIEAWDES